MKISRILPASVALALLLGVQPALGDGWSLEKLVPFGKKQTRKSVHKRPARPSPLEKLDIQVKRFFAGAKDALTWKKPAAKKKPTNQYLPWMRESNQQRYTHHNKRPKRSWLDALFRPKEPKPIESMEEWVGLPRLDP